VLNAIFVLRLLFSPRVHERLRWSSRDLRGGSGRPKPIARCSFEATLHNETISRSRWIGLIVEEFVEERSRDTVFVLGYCRFRRSRLPRMDPTVSGRSTSVCKDSTWLGVCLFDISSSSWPDNRIQKKLDSSGSLKGIGRKTCLSSAIFLSCHVFVLYHPSRDSSENLEHAYSI